MPSIVCAREAKKVGVIDRAISYGHVGPFFSEVKATMYGADIPISGFIAGLGGRDVSISDIETVARMIKDEEPRDIVWIGVKK